MTRLNDRLVVQRVDDQLVILDESTGAEIVFDAEMRRRLSRTDRLLFADTEERKVPGTVDRVCGTVASFEDYRGKVEVSDLASADVVTSVIETSANPRGALICRRSGDDAPEILHAPVIDLDVPVTYVPSTTEGHGHLYVDVPMTSAQMWALLSVMVSVGLVEEGYLRASLARGYTAVRLPWIKKEEPEPAAGALPWPDLPF